MLTLISYDKDTHTIHARTLEADAAGGDVLPGKATDAEIRDYANGTWLAPFELKEAPVTGTTPTQPWNGRAETMEPITISRDGEILAHHTTETPLSHYGTPVWVIEDEEPAPGPVMWTQGDNHVTMGVLGTVGGWLVCRQPGGLLCGIIWSDGNYTADLIVTREGESPVRDASLEDLSSGDCMVRGAVPMSAWNEESPLGCILPVNPSRAELFGVE